MKIDPAPPLNDKESWHRYLERYTTRTVAGCWEWQRAINKSGYGVIGVGGKVLRVHRIVYEVLVGPIGDGLLVCHRCDNRKCCNPEHLFPGTHLDNVRDAIAKGRQVHGEDLLRRFAAGRTPETLRRIGDAARENWKKPEYREKVICRGEANGFSKLNESQVREIRELAGSLSHRELAARFGVDRSLIGLVVSRKAWAHVQ